MVASLPIWFTTTITTTTTTTTRSVKFGPNSIQGQAQHHSVPIQPMRFVPIQTATWSEQKPRLVISYSSL
eukprot:jgi/Psemu1/306438/fgenesh1_kg.258_\